jgi:hypothetical protein
MPHGAKPLLLAASCGENERNETMNPWLQILEPQVVVVPARKKKERIYNGAKAGSLPCAKCKAAKRVNKSYCRGCHNEITRQCMRRKYRADKATSLQAGLNEEACHA